MSTTQQDLTKGSIIGSLWKLSLPIISASFIQIVYTLTDMFWLGRLGGFAVTAVGAAGFFAWMAASISQLTKVGTEVTVAQSVGRKQSHETAAFARHNMMIGFVLATIILLSYIFFPREIIYVLGTEADILDVAAGYLARVAPSLFFALFNYIFAAIYTSSGDSRTPFKSNVIGLTINMIADPLFIYGFDMGVNGAAWATTLSQMVVFINFAVRLTSSKSPIQQWEWKAPISKVHVKEILRIGFPTMVQNILFTTLSITMMMITAPFGSPAVGAYGVGSQIESVSWITAYGFCTAMVAFVGQNYGAKQWDRIRRGVLAMTYLAGGFGLIITLGFMIFPTQIFSLFSTEPQTIMEGARYIYVMGISQILMALEIAYSGIFYALGRPKLPAVNSVSINVLRIILAWFLSTHTSLGVMGIWIAISLGSCVKGINLILAYRILITRKLRE